MSESIIDKLDDYWKDYVLFSNKHLNASFDADLWKSKFNNENMQLIALNSLGK